MPFMGPEAIFTKMLHVETSAGTMVFPSNLVPATPTAADVRDYCEGEPFVYSTGDLDCERHEGWYARLSAPGYLDCTDWTGPHASESDALAALADLHDVCDKCWDQCYLDGDSCEEDS